VVLQEPLGAPVEHAPGEEDHPPRDLGSRRREHGVELQAGHLRHHDVAEHRVERSVLEHRQGRLAAVRHVDLVRPCEQPAGRARHQGLVVDHQDPCPAHAPCHCEGGASPLSRP
jgi:hypothetical protein